MIALTTRGDDKLKSMLDLTKDFVLEVPHAPELLTPIVMTIPLQLLAYDIAVRRGCDVDQPRNLAKSVTVKKEDGITEARVIQTGATDGTNTIVTSGLTERSAS